MTETDITSRLSHHFVRGILIAVITQGVQTLEEFMILPTMIWENVDNITETEKPKNRSIQIKIRFSIKTKRS